MTLSAVSTTQNGRGTRRARLPLVLVAMHATVMVLAGIMWIRNAADMGSPMAGHAAYFWYDLTRLESFPISYLARLLIEAAMARFGGSMPVSASAAIIEC